MKNKEKIDIIDELNKSAREKEKYQYVIDMRLRSALKDQYLSSRLEKVVSAKLDTKLPKKYEKDLSNSLVYDKIEYLKDKWVRDVNFWRMKYEEALCELASEKAGRFKYIEFPEDKTNKQFKQSLQRIENEGIFAADRVRKSVWDMMPFSNKLNFEDFNEILKSAMIEVFNTEGYYVRKNGFGSKTQEIAQENGITHEELVEAIFQCKDFYWIK